MKELLFKKGKKIIPPNEIIEVKVFKNKNNKQFNLPVMKRHTSPQIIKDILDNKDVVGLKFKITDVIFKNTIGKDVIFKKNRKGIGYTKHLSRMKGGKI